MGVMYEEYLKMKASEELSASLVVETVEAANRIHEENWRPVVLCKDCACKKAVSIGRVMVWRCPFSTVDVELDGFCHRGRKMNDGKQVE